MTRRTDSPPLPGGFGDLPAAALGDFPPGFQRLVFLLAPRRHRADLVQEAWAAYLEGRNPSTAARNYLTREVDHEEREHAVSQLCGDETRQYFRALAAGGTGRHQVARRKVAPGRRDTV